MQWKGAWPHPPSTISRRPQCLVAAVVCTACRAATYSVRLRMWPRSSMHRPPCTTAPASLLLSAALSQLHSIICQALRSMTARAPLGSLGAQTQTRQTTTLLPMCTMAAVLIPFPAVSTRWRSIMTPSPQSTTGRAFGQGAPSLQHSTITGLPPCTTAPVCGQSLGAPIPLLPTTSSAPRLESTPVSTPGACDRTRRITTPRPHFRMNVTYPCSRAARFLSPLTLPRKPRWTTAPAVFQAAWTRAMRLSTPRPHSRTTGRANMSATGPVARSVGPTTTNRA
mmetsp:Transcript_474/g.1380  ORF Transcript_474/g.1380 Transcript_474/m.1380 type:complete len:281 (-) Transcript_474:3162-4004(-)